MIERMFSTRRRKTGLAPGTPVHIGAHTEHPVQISVHEYDASGCAVRELTGPEDIAQLKFSTPVTWINVVGVHDVGTVTRICERFGVHSLVQEDIVNTDQRPKVEDYDTYLFVVVKMLRARDLSRIEVEQVSIIFLDRVIISFQERPGDLFDPIRSRLHTGKGTLRRRSADYLGYCLLDSIVDHYYILLEGIESRIAPLEETVVIDPDPDAAREIQSLKRDLLYLRRSLWPMREMIHRLSREESAMIHSDTRVFLRDLYDHVIHVIEILEGFQEIVAGTMDIYLSSMSNRMNNIMKLLTIISTIFIPLTFIAGIYGMNFAHMPELEFRWAYPVALGVMGLIAAAMLRFFRRKHWI